VAEAEDSKPLSDTLEPTDGFVHYQKTAWLQQAIALSQTP
jgi:hypothetical protein